MKPRHIQPLLESFLKDFPVVAIIGARQVGKSTLAQMTISPEWPAQYLTLDERLVLDMALSDPDGWIAGLGDGPVVIDEVQRAPDLLRAIKLSVDRNRKPGRFLITGSANIFTLSKVTETLAGRVAILELLPFSWRETVGQDPSTFLSLAFNCPNSYSLVQLLPSVSNETYSRNALIKEIMAGGFPPVREMKASSSRQRWFSSYRQTYLERDLRDISAIQNLVDFNRLLAISAGRSAEILNVAALSRDLGMVEMTVKRHLDLLETTYQIFRLPPYFINIGKRLVKRPKLYSIDSGFCAHLAGIRSWEEVERVGRVGAILETWVAGEIKKWIASQEEDYGLYYWRTHAGEEIDFLITKGDQVVAIEVKWTHTPSSRDMKGLVACEEGFGNRFQMGIILYGGTECMPLAPKRVAIPIVFALGA